MTVEEAKAFVLQRHPDARATIDQIDAIHLVGTRWYRIAEGYNPPVWLSGKHKTVNAAWLGAFKLLNAK